MIASALFGLYLSQSTSQPTFFEFRLRGPMLSLDGSTIVGTTDDGVRGRPVIWNASTGFRYIFDDPTARGVTLGVSRDGSVVLGEIGALKNGLHIGHLYFKTDEANPITGPDYSPIPGNPSYGPLMGVNRLNATGDTFTGVAKAGRTIYNSGYHVIPAPFINVEPGGRDGSFVGEVRTDRSNSNVIPGVGAVLIGKSLRLIGSFNNMVETVVKAANADSTILAGDGRNANLYRLPFIWKRDEGFQALPVRKGSTGSAFSITEDGSKVFGYVYPPLPGGGGPVVWIDGKEPITLESYWSNFGVKIAHLHEFALDAVSEDGLTFIFTKRESDARLHYYLRINPAIQKSKSAGSDGDGG